MADTDPVQEPEEGDETPISNWEFIDRVPSPEEVLKLLETLPAVWGVKTEDFADYVQVLPNSKKVKHRVPVDGGRTRVEESYHDIGIIYMSVAGRVKMIEAAQEAHRWRVDFEPEPVTPTGVPGMLQLDDRIVYREYCTIYEREAIGSGPARETVWVCIGRKPGTAWVPAKGGSQAAGSNPYEKVETSARGRSIAAWGFGVLPGSGVASYEEMMSQAPNRRALESEGSSGGERRMTRGEIMTELLTAIEKARQLRGVDQADIHRRVADYVVKSFGVDKEKFVKEDTDEEGEPVVSLDWKLVRDGQLSLALNQMRETLRKLADSESAV